MMGRGYRAGLYNAPPTISALVGDELARALNRRDRENRANWLANRQHAPGIMERVAGLFRKGTQ